MSTMTAPARAAARPAPRTPGGSGLRVVTGRPPLARGNAAFAALCVALLGGGLVALLMMNIALARGSYSVHTLQGSLGALTDKRDALRQDLATWESTSALAIQASAMGMVPAQSAAFLRLSDGTVVGVATPGSAADRFSVVTRTTPPPPKTKAELAAEKRAAEAKAAEKKAAQQKAAAAKAATTATGAATTTKPDTGATTKPSTKPTTKPSTKPSTKPTKQQ